MLNQRRIALIEDDEIMGGSIAQRLELEGAEIIWHKQMVRALGAIRTPRVPIDAVICDIILPDGTGEDLFATLCRTSTPPPFLFITGQGSIAQAVRLMQSGAVDYVTKPFDMSVFLDRLVLLMRPRNALEMPPLVGISPTAQRVEELVEQAANRNGHVTILGGPGTGKISIAKRLHELSDRCSAPFLTVNFARDQKVEQALFAAGGAMDAVGEGILCLQSIDRMSEALQDRLLTSLDRDFAGRIISTTDPTIEDEVATGSFRADLFAQLSEVEIPVPPFRQRPDDAVWLMNRLFDQLNAKHDPPLRGISALTEQALRGHDLSGGGREIRTRLTRAIQTARDGWIQPADLFPERLAEGDWFLTLAEARDAAERSQIIAALEQTGGHLGKTAKLLRIARTTLWEKMQKFGLS